MIYNGIIFLLIFYTYYNTIFTPIYAHYVSIVRLLLSLVCDIYLQIADTVRIAPRLPVKNPRKFKVKQHTNYPRSEDVTTAIEKNPGKDPPAIVFFCSESTLIQSGSILSC